MTVEEARGRTLAGQLQRAENLATSLIQKASEEQDKEKANDLYQQAHMVGLGARAEVTRLLPGYYVEYSNKPRPLVAIIEALEHMTEVLDVGTLPAPLAEDARGWYLDPVLRGVEDFCNRHNLSMTVHIEAHGCGYLDSSYWYATPRVQEEGSEPVDLPFYHVKDYFEADEGGAQAIEEVFDLPATYDPDTAELLRGFEEGEDE